MRLRRPRLVERPLEFHRPDQQTRHVAAVGVLAADANFTHARQVVDVVLFDLGAGEITNGPFEYEFCEPCAGHSLRRAYLRERAAAIAAQAQMHPELRHALFKREKTLCKFLFCCDRGEHDPVQFRHPGMLGADAHGPRTEPCYKECRLLQHAGELPVAES